MAFGFLCATTCPQVMCLVEHDLRTSRGTLRWGRMLRQDLLLTGQGSLAKIRFDTAPRRFTGTIIAEEQEGS